MRFGIPKYRLPRDVLDAEVERIVDLGVEIRAQHGRSTNMLEAMQGGRFDAAFLAVGAHIAKRAYIPAGSAAKILDAVSVLRRMEGEEKPMLGRRVVVYGGGNTALDVARTAKRLGAEEAIIVYRRTREKMPAHDFEVEEALQEGVLIKWLSTIKQADEARSITVEKMALDEKGFPQPTGEFETLEADSLVLALGQDVDLSLLDGVPGLTMKDGVVQVGADMMTGHAGHLRRRRHGARRAHRHGRRSATARRPRATSTPGCAASAIASAEEPRSGDLRQAEPLVLHRRAEDRAAGARHRAPPVDLRRGGQAGWTRPTRCSRRAAACPAATASNATTATACARTTR